MPEALVCDAMSLPGAYYETDRVRIYNARCEDILPRFVDRAFTHAIMDPPYSDHVHTNTRTNKGTDGASGGEEIELGFGHLTPALRALVAHHVRRLVTRWGLTFCDVESSHLWRRDLCGEDRWRVDEQEMAAHEYLRTGIWLKGGAMPQVTGDRPGSGYESIVITHGPRARGDGRTRWNGGGKSNVWRAPVPQRRDGRVHPSEKPWRLIAQLLRDFTDEGDVILDPFAGSGPLGRAVLDVPGRRAVLIEADEQWCAQAASRLGAPVPETNGQAGLQW